MLFQAIPDSSYQIPWQFVLPIIIGHLFIPLASFYFFCRLRQVPFRRGLGIGYVAFHGILTALALKVSIAGIFLLLSEILLLFVVGLLFQKQTHASAFYASALTISASSLCRGIAQWAAFYSFNFILSSPILILISDTARELLNLFLFLLFSRIILKHFQCPIHIPAHTELALLTVPVFFISLVEETIQNTIYGSTIMVDSSSGLLYPVINHAEILFLQIFACGCLFFALIAYQKIIASFYAWQNLQRFQQQIQQQKIYIQESKLRYEQTAAFRHDIKNHLTVLAQLLKADNSRQAYEYLICLEESLSLLSSPVQTGNAAVDALLGSKFSVAKQKKISVSCQLTLPKESSVHDYDWCIVLANAIDNALAACDELPEENRFLHISGRKKGNFYLILIENSCDPRLADLPKDGIGLSNIRAVMEKQNGTIHNQVSDGIYRLELLFLLPPFTTEN
jgi:sensor histidine kinase YesM